LRSAALASALIVALAGAACGGDTQTPTSATPTAPTPPTTRLFTGVLPVQGSAFFSFTAQRAGTASAMLASLTTNGRPIASRVGLGIGIPSGTDCATQTSADVTPALTAQVNYAAQPGTYCVRVYDIGALPAEAAFGVRIIYP